jgi:hypothetical protein
VEVLLVVPHREEGEQLRIARDLELRHFEEVVNGLALDVREIVEALDLRLGQSVLASDLPVEVFEVDLVGDGDVLSNV